MITHVGYILHLQTDLLHIWMLCCVNNIQKSVVRINISKSKSKPVGI